MVQNRIPRVCFNFCSMVKNSEHLSPLWNDSERNSESFLFRGTAGIPPEQTNCSVFFGNCQPWGGGVHTYRTQELGFPGRMHNGIFLATSYINKINKRKLGKLGHCLMLRQIMNYCSLRVQIGDQSTQYPEYWF